MINPSASKKNEEKRASSFEEEVVVSIGYSSISEHSRGRTMLEIVGCSSNETYLLNDRSATPKIIDSQLD